MDDVHTQDDADGGGGSGVVICPHCGAETPEGEWNCVACRINMYWATQHYDELAKIRGQRGLDESAPSPSFLVKAHREAMDDRADRGGRVEHKVRQVARKVMRQRP